MLKMIMLKRSCGLGKVLSIGLHSKSSQVALSHAVGSPDLTQQEMKDCEEHQNHQRLIQILNTGTIQHLQSYRLTKKAANKILLQRKKHGLLLKLGDLEKIEGFNEDTVKALYENFLAGPVDINLLSRKPLCTPKLSVEAAKSISDMVAFHINPEFIAWTHLSRNYRLLDWQVRELNWGKAYDHHHCFNMSSDITAHLPPDTSAYILEQNATRLVKPQQFPAAMMSTCLEAMLITWFNRSSNHRTYIVRGGVVSNHFDLNVGGERVSGQAVLDGLLQAPHLLDASPSIAATYRRESPGRREVMSNSALLAVAFNRLIVNSPTTQTS